MTALTQYQRLESIGLWRPDPEGQRREVIISFGDATLVIADSAARPLAHWSLPAISRLNPGESPALYSPDIDAGEDLEIDDDTMIDAIETVRRSIARQRPKPGRLRHVGLGLSIASVIGVVFFWAPGALERQALDVVPLAKRSEIGATILGHLQRLNGASCRDPLGVASLNNLRARLLPADYPGQIVVVPGEVAPSHLLPGGVIVLNRALLEQSEDPAVVAGHIIARATEFAQSDILKPVLDYAGTAATARLMTTGDLPPDILAGYAEVVATSSPPILPGDLLLPAFEAARVASTPLAYAIDPSGETTLPLIEADPMSGQAPVAILTDGEWVALQGICSG